MPKGCWWNGTNPIHPWSKQPVSPPSKLPLLTCFTNSKPPKAKPALSQCKIIPNSCSKGNSLLITHGILQPREALEGRASTACMGDGVLQGLRLPSGPLRKGGNNLSRTPDTGRKSPRKAEGAEDKSPAAPKYFQSTLPFRPNHGAWTHQLPAHTAAASGSSRKAAPQEHTQPGGQRDNPPLLSWSTNLSQSVPKEGLPSRVEQHPHYSRATNSHASAQIASLNVIALSQFHEFNIVPRLLFA